MNAERLLAELDEVRRSRTLRVSVVVSSSAREATAQHQAALTTFRSPSVGSLDVVSTDADWVGVDRGGGVESLLRALLALPDGDGDDVLTHLRSHVPGAAAESFELLAFAAGLTRANFGAARLEARSRWESALAEVARCLVERNRPVAWLLDGASGVDAESVALWSVLSGVAVPVHVVLFTSIPQRAVLDGRLEPLRACRAPLVVLESGGASSPSLERDARPPSTRLDVLPETAPVVVASPAELSAQEEETVAVLHALGGRVPLSALEAAGQQRARVEALAQRGPLRVGTTRRSEGLEVWLAHGVSAPPLAPEVRRGVVRAVATWVEQRVLAASDLERARALLIPLLAQLSAELGDTLRASLSYELLARSPPPAVALAKAEAGATGVRRLVLARRLAEDELFRGESQRALATVNAALRLPGAGSATLLAPWLPLLQREAADELERWTELGAEEAFVALDLLRAEILSQLAQTAETRRAFTDVEARLVKLKPSPAVWALWLRMARTWSWFVAEMLGDGAAARQFCDRTRKRIGEEGLRASFHAPAFLRAAQIAESHGGDPVRARALADELIELARSRGDARDECVAWNARGILHLREGELPLAQKSFERSLSMARSIGFRRREAVALHNLGLTLAAAGEASASLDAQESYLTLSDQIGNSVARAYGPAAMAMVFVHQDDAEKAEPLIAKARKAAEDNNWVTLVAWTRHLQGQLKLARFAERRDTLLLSQARADFLACLDLIEDRRSGWSEELDPAEVATCIALTFLFNGQKAQAAQVAARAFAYENESACSRAHVGALRAVLDGQAPTASLEWFDAHAQVRLGTLWRKLLALLPDRPKSGA